MDILAITLDEIYKYSKNLRDNGAKWDFPFTNVGLKTNDELTEMGRGVVTKERVLGAFTESDTCIWVLSEESYWLGNERHLREVVRHEFAHAIDFNLDDCTTFFSTRGNGIVQRWFLTTENVIKWMPVINKFQRDHYITTTS